mgnify:CR=1 FL=1
MKHKHIINRLIKSIIYQIQNYIYEKTKGEAILIPLDYDNIRVGRFGFVFTFHYLIMSETSAKIKSKDILWDGKTWEVVPTKEDKR